MLPRWHGCCLTWARATQIPANPTAAVVWIISLNIALNRPAIHGSNRSGEARASPGPARTLLSQANVAGGKRGEAVWAA